ncbi:27 kDa antigen Cfp30B [Frondihabitans sp. 762G35]|uniref:VOC family protein n=1 Tax=Frondihabitans sp. 762G35 TaxID=1446794 RepID=UPI000D202886|nr:VOC family protein [Frondihabitans sp. 762G35]ARC58264.1 27 kDa antigen Cfp30B [Frondihabitans sp. 762G35]
MPTVPVFPTGAPIWIDLSSSDPDASRAFYEALFGWSSVDTGPDFGDYVNFSLGDAQVAGMAQNPEPEKSPDAWVTYLQASDAETTASAVTGAGGMVVGGPHVVGPLGTMLVAVDADRAVVGAWQPEQHRGFGVLDTVGAPSWFELHTTNFHDEVQFYQQAFGWQTASMGDTDEFRYEQLMVDEKPYAGVMDATAYWPAGDPAAWRVYFRVADVDAAVSRVVELGGRVLDPAVDTPYGRLAELADVTGAIFKLIA